MPSSSRRALMDTPVRRASCPIVIAWLIEIHSAVLLPGRCRRLLRNTAKIYGMPVMLGKPEIAVKASARLFKGLGDATRLRILELLLERERTVGELVELLDLPQARVSTHLACLRWCALV